MTLHLHENNNAFDHVYLQMLRDISQEGFIKGDRTGTGTLSSFGQAYAVDLADNKLPVLTTKKIFLSSVIHEMLWFISGSTDVAYLKQNNVGIWDSWVKHDTARYQHRTWAEVYKAIEDSDDLEEFIRLTQARNVDDGTLLHYDLNTNGLTEEDKSTCDAILAKHQVKITKLIGGSIGTGAYGSQWRNWEDTRIVAGDDIETYYNQGYQFVSSVTNHDDKAVVTRNIDQLAEAIKLLRTNPDSRRIIVSAWNPGKLADAVLPPCHSLFQFYSRELTVDEAQALIYNNKYQNDPEITIDLENSDLSNVTEKEYKSLIEKVYPQWISVLKKHSVPVRKLSLCMYQRSCDAPVGHPFNVTQYALLAHLVAHVTGHTAEKFVWFGADVHIYQNQHEKLDQQLHRLPFEEVQPTVHLNAAAKEIDEFKFEDITIIGYDKHHPPIAYPVAV